MSVALYFEPIELWPSKPTSYAKRSPFKSTLDATQNLLERELEFLKAKQAVVQAFFKREQLRLDGGIRAGATPHKPGVIVSFDSKNGPMSFPCDKYDRWQDNLRAIALGLEALRKLDRYGITYSAEQYKGWLRLPPPSPNSIETQLRTREDAIAFLKRLVSDFAAGAIDEVVAVRRAQALTHPDRRGDPEDFKRVMRCEELLKR